MTSATALSLKMLPSVSTSEKTVVEPAVPARSLPVRETISSMVPDVLSFSTWLQPASKTANMIKT